MATEVTEVTEVTGADQMEVTSRCAAEVSHVSSNVVTAVLPNLPLPTATFSVNVGQATNRRDDEKLGMVSWGLGQGQ